MRVHHALRVVGYPVLTGTQTYLLAEAPNHDGPANGATAQTARFTVYGEGEVYLTARCANYDSDGGATVYFKKNGSQIGSWPAYGVSVVFSMVVGVAVGDVLTVELRESDSDLSHAMDTQQVWAGENYVGCVVVG